MAQGKQAELAPEGLTQNHQSLLSVHISGPLHGTIALEAHPCAASGLNLDWADKGKFQIPGCTQR